MADLEIYVNGTALKQAQGANAIVDTMSATVIKKHNPGMSDTQLRQLITAHIDEDEFCRYVIQRDINGIALALRETVKAGRQPIHFSLDGFLPSCYFSRSVATHLVTVSRALGLFVP